MTARKRRSNEMSPWTSSRNTNGFCRFKARMGVVSCLPTDSECVFFFKIRERSKQREHSLYSSVYRRFPLNFEHFEQPRADFAARHREAEGFRVRPQLFALLR